MRCLLAVFLLSWSDARAGTTEGKPQIHGVASARGWYDNGTLRRVELQYSAGGYLKEFRGYCQPDGTPALGAATLADGNSYVGFFLRQRPYGAGILTSRAGAQQSGYFDDGKLVHAATVSFPLSSASLRCRRPGQASGDWQRWRAPRYVLGGGRRPFHQP